MSLVYEDEKTKQVCVALAKNDYVKVLTMDKEVTLIIRNKDGKLCVEQEDKNNKEKGSVYK